MPALPTGIDWLIFLGGLGFTACLVPQVMRTYKRGRADDISLLFLITVIIASSLSLVYFVLEGHGWFVYYGYIATIAAWVFVLWYRIFPRTSDQPSREP